MTTRKGPLEWARRSIRSNELQLLGILVCLPWFLLGQAADNLFGAPAWRGWDRLILLAVLVAVAVALVRNRNAEERLLVYWLACGIAAIVGTAAAVVMLMIAGLGERLPVAELTLSGAAAAVAVVGFVLVQIYYRFERIERRLGDDAQARQPRP